jgi:hypothetical protein
VLRPAPQARIVELHLLNPFNDKEALDDKLSVGHQSPRAHPLLLGEALPEPAA